MKEALEHRCAVREFGSSFAVHGIFAHSIRNLSSNNSRIRTPAGCRNHRERILKRPEMRLTGGLRWCCFMHEAALACNRCAHTCILNRPREDTDISASSAEPDFVHAGACVIL